MMDSVSTQVTWTPPTVRDNSHLPVDVSTNFAPGAVFSIGVTTVTYIFTDVAGNDVVCDFNVTVTECKFAVI